MSKIQFGTANHYKKGFINCDINDKFGKIDKAIDLNVFPYPFKSNSAELIIHEHTMEHLDKPQEFMKECHRILKKGAIMRFKIPYRNLDATNHKFSFKMSYFESFDANRKSLLGKKFDRGTNWTYVNHTWREVDVNFNCTSMYNIIMGGNLLCKLINKSLFLKRFYDNFFFNWFLFDEMEVIMVK